VRLKVEGHDQGHVVGGLFHGAHIAVDVAGDQTVGGLGGQEGDIDADAVVSLPSAGLIIPECIGVRISADGGVGVGEAEPF
jgi:hypothetical protein